MYNQTKTTTHEITALIRNLKDTPANEELIKLFEEAYAIKDGIISNFKKDNNITNQVAFYESLRYPIDNKFKNKYDYTSLRYNGNDGIAEMKILVKKLKLISTNVLEEYKKMKSQND